MTVCRNTRMFWWLLATGTGMTEVTLTENTPSNDIMYGPYNVKHIWYSFYYCERCFVKAAKKQSMNNICRWPCECCFCRTLYEMQASLERFGVVLRQRMADLHVCEAQQNKVSPLFSTKDTHCLSLALFRRDMLSLMRLSKCSVSQTHSKVDQGNVKITQQISWQITFWLALSSIPKKVYEGRTFLHFLQQFSLFVLTLNCIAWLQLHFSLCCLVHSNFKSNEFQVELASLPILNENYSNQ